MTVAYNASSLKQQSADRPFATPGHIILIPNQPVLDRSPYHCVISGEASNTNFIIFGLAQSGLEPTIYRTLGEHANLYTTDAVTKYIIVLCVNMKQIHI
jgi:hypothetical protein